MFHPKSLGAAEKSGFASSPFSVIAMGSITQWRGLGGTQHPTRKATEYAISNPCGNARNPVSFIILAASVQIAETNYLRCTRVDFSWAASVSVANDLAAVLIGRKVTRMRNRSYRTN